MEKEAQSAGQLRNDDLTEATFVERFVARMLAVAGPVFDDGDSIEDYAKQIAPTYWNEWKVERWKIDTPEYLADTDISYWGE